MQNLSCVRCLKPYDPNNNPFGACVSHSSYELSEHRQKPRQIEAELESLFKEEIATFGVVDLNYILNYIPLRDLLLQLESPCTIAIKGKLDALPLSISEIISGLTIRKIRKEIPNRFPYEQRRQNNPREAEIITQLLSDETIQQIDAKLAEEQARNFPSFRYPHPHTQRGRDYDPISRDYIWRCCGRKNSEGGCWTGRHSSSNPSPDAFTVDEFSEKSFSAYFANRETISFGSQHCNNPITNEQLLSALKKVTTFNVWTNPLTQFVRLVILFNAYNGYEFTDEKDPSLLVWQLSRRTQVSRKVESEIEISLGQYFMWIEVKRPLRFFKIRTIHSNIDTYSKRLDDNSADFDQPWYRLPNGQIFAQYEISRVIPVGTFMLPLNRNYQNPPNPRILTKQIADIIDRELKPSTGLSRKARKDLARLARDSWVDFDNKEKAKVESYLQDIEEKERLRQTEIALQFEIKRTYDYLKNRILGNLDPKVPGEPRKLLEFTRDEIIADETEFFKVDDLQEKLQRFRLLESKVVQIEEYIQYLNILYTNPAAKMLLLSPAAVQVIQNDSKKNLQNALQELQDFKQEIAKDNSGRNLDALKLQVDAIEANLQQELLNVDTVLDIAVLEVVSATAKATTRLVDAFNLVLNAPAGQNTGLFDLEKERSQIANELDLLIVQVDDLLLRLRGKKKSPALRQVFLTASTLLRAVKSALPKFQTIEEIERSKGTVNGLQFLVGELEATLMGDNIVLPPFFSLFMQIWLEFKTNVSKELQRSNVPNFKRASNAEKALDLILRLINNTRQTTPELVAQLSIDEPDLNNALGKLKRDTRNSSDITVAERLIEEIKTKVDNLMLEFYAQEPDYLATEAVQKPVLKETLEENIEKFKKLIQIRKETKPAKNASKLLLRLYYKRMLTIVEFVGEFINLLGSQSEQKYRSLYLQVSTNKDYKIDIENKYVAGYEKFKLTLGDAELGDLRNVDLDFEPFIRPLLLAFYEKESSLKEDPEALKQQREKLKKKKAADKAKEQAEEVELKKKLDEFAKTNALSKNEEDFILAKLRWEKALDFKVIQSGPIDEALSIFKKTAEFLDVFLDFSKKLIQSDPETASLRVDMQKWSTFALSNKRSIPRLPSFPTQEEDETDEDFQQRIKEYQELKQEVDQGRKYVSSFSLGSSISLSQIETKLVNPFNEDFQKLNQDNPNWNVVDIRRVLNLMIQFSLLLANAVIDRKKQSQSSEQAKKTELVLQKLFDAPESEKYTIDDEPITIYDEIDQIGLAIDDNDQVSGLLWTRMDEVLKYCKLTMIPMDIAIRIADAYLELLKYWQDSFLFEDVYYYAIDPVFLDFIDQPVEIVTDSIVTQIDNASRASGFEKIDKNSNLRASLITYLDDLYKPEIIKYSENQKEAFESLFELLERTKSFQGKLWDRVEQASANYRFLDSAFEKEWFSLDTRLKSKSLLSYLDGFLQIYTNNSVLKRFNLTTLKKEKSEGLDSIFLPVLRLFDKAQEIFDFRPEVLEAGKLITEIKDYETASSTGDQILSDARLDQVFLSREQAYVELFRLGELAEQVMTLLGWTRRYRGFQPLKKADENLSELVKQGDQASLVELKKFYQQLQFLGLQLPLGISYLEQISDKQLEEEQTQLFEVYRQLLRPTNIILPVSRDIDEALYDKFVQLFKNSKLDPRFIKSDGELEPFPYFAVPDDFIEFKAPRYHIAVGNSVRNRDSSRFNISKLCRNIKRSLRLVGLQQRYAS